jgi:PKD repeat protein
VNTNQNQYILDYSDAGPEGAALNWQGGNGGIGIYIEPPVYPIKIVGSQFHIASNSTTAPTGFSAIIYDDDGPNGAPGTVLDSVYVTSSSINTGSYNTVLAQDTGIYIQNGGVYLVWYMGGPDISLSRDLTPPASARSLELLGGVWADYRGKLTEDFLMGLIVADAPLPKARFNIDSSQAPLISFTDQSTKNPTSWHWDFGYNNDTSNLKNPSYTYPANGTYTVCLWVTNSFGSDSICKQLTIRNIGLEDLTFDYKPYVYPNPSNGFAYIDLPKNGHEEYVSLKFTTVAGQQLNLPYTIRNNRFEFNAAKLASGFYLFQVLTKDHSEVIAQGKFMVE